MMSALFPTKEPGPGMGQLFQKVADTRARETWVLISALSTTQRVIFGVFT